MCWLQIFEGGRFAVEALQSATGADLYWMLENAYIATLGPVLGSLYGGLHDQVCTATNETTATIVCIQVTILQHFLHCVLRYFVTK
jgi:hypothetical protein